MSTALLLALALVQSAPPAADPAAPATRAQPVQPLQSYFRSWDYPMEAVAFGVQGSVEVRLDIDSEGRVRRCRPLRSRGARLFGRVSCDILRRRARFHPARDAAGNPVPDSCTRRIYWGLPSNRDPIPPLDGPSA